MANTNNKNIKIEMESSEGSLVDLSEHWKFGSDSIRLEGMPDVTIKVRELGSSDFTIRQIKDSNGETRYIVEDIKSVNRFIRWWRGTRLYHKLFWKHYTFKRKVTP